MTEKINESGLSWLQKVQFYIGSGGRSIISSIGLEEDRVGIIVRSKEIQETLANLIEQIMDRISQLPPSPVFKKSVNA